MPIRGWDNHGFLNDKGGSSRACRNQVDGHDDGVEVLAFSHMLNVFVPAIFCILWYIFLLNVTNYAFNFLFSCIHLWGIIPSPAQGVDKGRGKANHMWTQWRNVDPSARNDEWDYNEWKGSNIYG